MNLIKKFILFLLITSIIPIVTLWFFLFKETNDKLNERDKYLSSTAKMLVAEHVVNDLDKLLLANNQAVLLTVSSDYERFKKLDDSKPLEITLNKFQESGNLGIVALIDSKRDVVASTDTFEDASKDSLDRLMQIALAGTAVKSIEKLKLSLDDSDTLMYVSVAPVFSNKEEKEIIGALLIGQSIEENNSFNQISKVIPNIQIEVACKKIHNCDLLPLESYFGDQIGHLSIHISQDSDNKLKLRNTLLMFLYLILIVIAITIFALRFNQSFVRPMNQVADACDKLSNGDLDAKVRSKTAKGEVKRIIHSFNKMVQQLSDDDKMRSNFISTLSHDLKTPLIAQRRAFDLLQEFHDELGNEFVRLLKGVNLNNEHLLNMVRLLLETYKYNPSEIIVDKQETKIYDLIDDVQITLKPLLDSKQIEFVNKISKDSELLIDVGQFKRVLLNLFGNAIENVPVESQISCELLEEEAELILKISDNGYGIEPDILPYIFERYFTRSKSKQKIGTGLGLFICKTIVEAHNGTIDVTSEVNSGTTFYIHLPKA